MRGVNVGSDQSIIAELCLILMTQCVILELEIGLSVAEDTILEAKNQAKLS
jgi:hypothetical protein